MSRSATSAELAGKQNPAAGTPAASRAFPQHAAVLSADGALDRAIAAVNDLGVILDGLRAGALPPQFWLDARHAFANVAACPDLPAGPGSAALRRRCLRWLDMLGGPPESP